jgi:tRNA A-37 threonylcarbamoyl transferase component Bud32
MRSYQDVGVVPPVACYPDELAIVTEQVSGPTLQQHLARRASWFPSRETTMSLTALLETTGRWIRVFQQSLPEGGEVDLGEFRYYVDHRLKRLVATEGAGFSDRDRQAVLQRIDDLSRLVPRSQLREVFTHSDLALGNILVNGTRVVVLDFAMTKAGCRLVDLTRLFVQIQVLAVKPQIRARVIRPLQEALVRGYDPSLSTDDPLFRLFLLRNRINHLITLRSSRSTGLSAAYSRAVCRDHERWLRRELETAAHAEPR